MTKRKWTSGPWSAPVGTKNPVQLIGGTVFKIRQREDDNTPIIFVAGLDDECAEEGMANAHLIAAAPDLYEALELLHNNLSYDMSQSEYDMVSAALAKARGEA